LICDANATTVVEPGWRAEMTAQQHLLLSRVGAPAPRQALGTRADPVMLEIFNNRFMAIAEQMGSTLEKTAHSVNIKERLDFSCALFTPPASWSPMPRTSPCTWAQWATRCVRCCAPTR